MIIHAMDSLPAYEAVVSQPATAIGGRPLFDRPRMVAAVDRTVTSGSMTDAVAPVMAADRCFVHPGTGGWDGVITICEDGRVSTLAQVRRPALVPAVYHVATPASVTRIGMTRVGGSSSWATWVSGALLTLGLALSIKFAVMTLGHPASIRRFG